MNENNNRYVPNDVFKFVCVLKNGLSDAEETVYTKPFPSEKNADECSEIVQKHYFTKEKINELKQKLIEKINKCDNPFEIYCSDIDGDYNVTEEKLFIIEEI